MINLRDVYLLWEFPIDLNRFLETAQWWQNLELSHWSKRQQFPGPLNGANSIFTYIYRIIYHENEPWKCRFLPGSSRCVKFLPFGSVFFVVKRHTFYTQKEDPGMLAFFKGRENPKNIFCLGNLLREGLKKHVWRGVFLWTCNKRWKGRAS